MDKKAKISLIVVFIIGIITLLSFIILVPSIKSQEGGPEVEYYYNWEKVGNIKTYYPSTVYNQNLSGDWVNASDTFRITLDSDDITFHYEGYEGYFNLTFEAGVIYGPSNTYHSMAEAKSLTNINFDFPTQKYKNHRKYAVNITNISDTAKTNTKNITLTYKDHYGFTIENLKIYEDSWAVQNLYGFFEDLRNSGFVVKLDKPGKRIYITPGNWTVCDTNNCSINHTETNWKLSGDGTWSLYLDPTTLYVPNIAGNGGWQGSDFSSPPPTSLSKLKEMVLSASNLNTISVQAGYLTSAGAGGEDCSAKTVVASCTGLAEGACGNSCVWDGSPETTYSICFWADPDCVATSECTTYPGHQIRFNITEAVASINNISIRLSSQGTDEGFNIYLYAWNHTKGSYLQLDVDDCNDVGTGVQCNLTGVIWDIANFVNASGDLFLSTEQDYGNPLAMSYVHYIEAVVDYESGEDTTLPFAWLKSPVNGTILGIATRKVYFEGNFTDETALGNATVYVRNSTLSLINNTETITIAGTANVTNISIILPYDGTFFWNYYVCDAAKNCAYNSTNWTLIIDTIKPNMIFIYPTNTTYNINISNLNYTYSDTNPSSCWYSRNIGVTNSTAVTAGINWSNVVSIEGSNNYTVFCNDSANNINKTTVYFTEDTIDPAVIIIYPTNTTYNINISTLNYTYSDTNPSSCWYSRDRGAVNSTAITAGINWSNVVSIEGSNNYTVFCNDSINNINMTTLYFTKDTIDPAVIIIYPTNITYSINVSALNYTFTDPNAGSCWYSRNIGLVNSTSIASGVNFTGITSIEGSNNFTVYCNDSANNINTSLTLYFFKDTINPQIKIIYPTNTTYNINISNLNFTVGDANLETCLWSRDGWATNTTITCGTNKSDMVSVAGNNTYLVWANDTSGNANFSSVTFTANTISVCQKITLPGVYYMIGNIINSATTACINITTENVTLNCQNYLIDGNDAADYGIWIERTTAINTNITITNCALNDWDTEAIHITSAHGTNFSNVNVTSSPDWGIYLRNSNNSIFENIKILNSLDDGIYLSYSHYNNLTGVNTTDNTLYGIRISTGSYNLIKDSYSLRGGGGVYLTTNSDYNNIINLTATLSSYGVYLTSSTSQNNFLINSSIIRSTTRGIYIFSSTNNTIYNNLFNNSNNFQFLGTTVNIWNTTTATGTNVVGGNKIAGNFWATPAGTGFSQTPSLCGDIDADGVCNNAYVMNANNRDYVPLSDATAPDTTAPKIYFTSYPAGKINGEQIIFSGYLIDETMGKNLTFVVYNGTASLAANTTSALSIYLTYYFNSTPYSTGENLTFQFLGYDSALNSNQTNITLTIDHNVPILSPNPSINPSITPSKTYYRTNDIITLRINITDGSGAGMNYVQINPKNINGTNLYTNITLESGNKGTGNYSTFNFTVTVNNETALNKPIYFYLVDAATPVPNTLNYTITYNLDNTIPTYSTLISSTPITNNTEGTFSVTGFDNYDLGSYIFAQNSTGTWQNNSPASISGTSYVIITTFTPTIIGNFSYYFIINDSAGNQNTTALGDAEVTEVVDLIVYLHYPLDNTFLSTATVPLNWSYEMGIAINCSLYINDTFNQTYVNPLNYTTYNFTIGFSDGSYYWYASCIQNETWEVFNSEIWNFTTDTVFSQNKIIYPTNTTYNVNISNLNYTYTDINPSSCWYSKNIGLINSTSVASGVNFTGITSIEGSNNYTLYCNDSANNLNTTITLYFWKDTIAPLCTIVSPNNSVYLNATIYFNITTNEELSYSVYSFNNWTNNYTLTTINLSYYSAVNKSMQEGIQTVRFWCNDTSGNSNTSSITFGGLDTIHPDIQIIEPANNTYYALYSINISLNVSVNYSDITGYWWSYNEGKNNYSFTPNTTMSWDQPGSSTYVYNITVWVNDTHNNVAFNISMITVETVNPGGITGGGGGGGASIVTGGNITNVTGGNETIAKKVNKTALTGKEIKLPPILKEVGTIFYWIGNIISPSEPIKIGLPIFFFGIFAIGILYFDFRKKHKYKKEKPINITINNPWGRKKQWRKYASE